MRSKNKRSPAKNQKKAKKENFKSAFSWKHSANRIVKKLQEHGYKGDEDGVCHGVACVAAAHMFQNSVHQFDHDLLHVRDANPPFQNHSVENHVLLSCIELSQQPTEYPEYIPHQASKKRVPIQHLLTVMPLIQSQQIETEGGVISARTFSGVYGIMDLTFCLSAIRDAINKYPHPMAILLSDEAHIIAIQYHPYAKEWIFVDARSLPSRYYRSEYDLAVAIGRTLAPELRKTVLSASVYVTRKNAAIANRAVDEYTNTTAWKTIHSVHRENKLYWTRWLFISAADGCIKEAALLLAAGANYNAKYNGKTALCSAAQQGNTDIVKLLLQYGALTNGPGKLSRTPLYYALFHGHHKISDSLRQHGAALYKNETRELENRP